MAVIKSSRCSSEHVGLRLSTGVDERRCWMFCFRENGSYLTGEFQRLKSQWVSLCLSVSLSVSLSLSLSVSVCVFVRLSLCLSLSLFLSVSLCPYLSVSLPVCLSLSLSLAPIPLSPSPSLSSGQEISRFFFFFWVLSRDSGLDMRWRQSTTKTGKLCLIGTGDESSCYEYMMCVQIKLSVSATARVLTEKLKNTWALHCCDVHSKQRFREICYQDVCSEKNSAISSALNEFFCKVCCQDMCSKRTATSAAEMSVQRKYSTTSTA